MQKFAEYMVEALDYKLPAGQGLVDIAHGSDRYVLYKVGPVLSVSVSMAGLKGQSPAYFCAKLAVTV